jgi:hypothetical protein
MKNTYQLGQKVIVNTGGEDTIAHIDKPVKDINGHYWESQDCYLCRFTDNDKKLFCNGAVPYVGGIYDVDTNYIFPNAQYIPTKYIKPYQN